MKRGYAYQPPVVLPPAGAGRGVLRSCFGLATAEPAPLLWSRPAPLLWR